MSEDKDPILGEDANVDKTQDGQLTPEREKSNSNNIYDKHAKLIFSENLDRETASSPKLDEISAHLSRIVDPPQKPGPVLAKELLIAKGMDYRSLEKLVATDSTASKLLSGRLSSTIQSTATLGLLQFHRTVSRGYMRRELALSYKRTITLNNISSSITQMGGILESKLEAIKINTGRSAQVATEGEPPTIFEELFNNIKAEAKGRVVDYGKSLAQKLLRSDGVQEVYNKIIQDANLGITKVSEGIDGIRGKEVGSTKFLSPLRTVVSWADKKDLIKNDSFVNNLVMGALPLLEEARPDIFKKRLTEAEKLQEEYRKEEQRPTYNLIMKWRDRQLESLDKIVSLMGGNPTPKAPVGSGESARQTVLLEAILECLGCEEGDSKHKLTPRPDGFHRKPKPDCSCDIDTKQGHDNDNWKNLRNGGAPLGEYEQSTVDVVDAIADQELPLASGDFVNPRDRARARLSRAGRTAKLRYRIVRRRHIDPHLNPIRERISENIPREQVDRWIARARNTGTLTRQEIDDFRFFAREYGTRAALDHYREIAQARANDHWEDLQLRGMMVGDQLREARDYARENGTQAALSRYGNELRGSAPVRAVTDRVQAVHAQGLRQTASNAYTSFSQSRVGGHAVNAYENIITDPRVTRATNALREGATTIHEHIATDPRLARLQDRGRELGAQVADTRVGRRVAQAASDVAGSRTLHDVSEHISRLRGRESFGPYARELQHGYGPYDHELIREGSRQDYLRRARQYGSNALDTATDRFRDGRSEEGVRRLTDAGKNLGGRIAAGATALGVGRAIGAKEYGPFAHQAPGHNRFRSAMRAFRDHRSEAEKLEQHDSTSDADRNATNERQGDHGHPQDKPKDSDGIWSWLTHHWKEAIATAAGAEAVRRFNRARQSLFDNEIRAGGKRNVARAVTNDLFGSFIGERAGRTGGRIYRGGGRYADYLRENGSREDWGRLFRQIGYEAPRAAFGWDPGADRSAGRIALDGAKFFGYTLPKSIAVDLPIWAYNNTLGRALGRQTVASAGKGVWKGIKYTPTLARKLAKFSVYTLPKAVAWDLPRAVFNHAPGAVKAPFGLGGRVGGTLGLLLAARGIQAIDHQTPGLKASVDEAAQGGLYTASLMRLLGKSHTRFGKVASILGAGYGALHGSSQTGEYLSNHVARTGAVAGGLYGLLKLLGQGDNRFGKVASAAAGLAFDSAYGDPANAATPPGTVNAAARTHDLDHPRHRPRRDGRDDASILGAGTGFGTNLAMEYASTVLAPNAKRGLLGQANKRLGTSFNIDATPRQNFIPTGREWRSHAGRAAAFSATDFSDLFNRDVTDTLFSSRDADGNRSRANQMLAHTASGVGSAIQDRALANMLDKRAGKFGALYGALSGSGELNTKSTAEAATIGGSAYGLMRLFAKDLAQSSKGKYIAAGLGILGANPGIWNPDKADSSNDPNKPLFHKDPTPTVGETTASVGTLGLGAYLSKAIPNAWKAKSASGLLLSGGEALKAGAMGVAGSGGIIADLVNDKIVDRLIPATRKDGSKNKWNHITRTAVGITGNAIAGAELGRFGGPWGMAIGAVVGGTYGYFKENPKQAKELWKSFAAFTKKGEDALGLKPLSSKQTLLGKMGVLVHDANALSPLGLTTSVIRGVANGVPSGNAGGGTDYGPVNTGVRNDNSDLKTDPIYKQAYSHLNKKLQERMDKSKALRYTLYSYSLTNGSNHAADILNKRFSPSLSDKDLIRFVGEWRATNEKSDRGLNDVAYKNQIFDQQQTATNLLMNPNGMSNSQLRISAGGTGLVGAPPIPKAESLALARQAVNFFMSKGYPQVSALTIVASLYVESGLNIGAVGDNGHALGLAQWHSDRRGPIEKHFGKSLSNMTFQEQLAAVDWEMQTDPNGAARGAGKLLMKATSIEQAADIVVNKYERPADRAGNQKRRGAQAYEFQRLFFGNEGAPAGDGADPGQSAGSPGSDRSGTPASGGGAPSGSTPGATPPPAGSSGNSSRNPSLADTSRAKVLNDNAKRIREQRSAQGDNSPASTSTPPITGSPTTKAPDPASTSKSGATTPTWAKDRKPTIPPTPPTVKPSAGARPAPNGTPSQTPPPAQTAIVNNGGNNQNVFLQPQGTGSIDTRRPNAMH